MIYTSLAVVALAASAAIPPFGNLVHIHPKAKPVDDRIQVMLVNPTLQFRDVKVAGHTYTVSGGHTMTVKAPAGTVIYRDSFAPFHAKGEVLAALTPEMNHQSIDLK